MTADLVHDETEILPPARPVDYEREKESLMNFDRRSRRDTIVQKCRKEQTFYNFL